MLGNPDDQWLLSSDAGYGFIVKLIDLASTYKAGKAILKVPQGSRPNVPYPMKIKNGALIAAVSSIGKLLVFSAEELPELAKGKGNKLLNIPTKKFKLGEEKLAGVVIINEGDALQIYRDELNFMTLKWKDLQNFIGDRAHRGKNYSKKFKRATGLAVDKATKNDDS
jgi:topoisomerase-4 subunit A